MSHDSNSLEQITVDNASCQSATTDKNFPSSRTLKWSVTVLLAYFGLRLLFLACRISSYVPPDEVTNFGICKIFSKVLLLPGNSSESFQYGLVTNVPWLYYWIMGKLLTLNFFGIPDLLFLRLLNIPMAFVLVYYVWRTLRLLTDDRLTQLLLIVAMTNTMMLSFLSAFVSYDNLTNLLAAMAIYYQLAFFKKRSGNLLAVSIVCQLAGCLTKITFLPLALILNIVLLIHEFSRLRALFPALAAYFRNTGRAKIVLTVALLFGLAFNVQLYGGNYQRYGALVPEASKVIPLESAMQYRLTARNYILSQFRSGRITKEQALEMTSQIQHKGDRENAVELIESYEEFKNNGSHFMGLWDYTQFWVARMSAGVFGVFGHLAVPNEWPTIAPIALLAVLSLLAFCIRWRPWEEAWLPSCLALFAGFYAFILMYVFNYDGYLATGAPYTALQGRYIFPVIGPIYILASLYLLRLFKGKGARLTVFALATLILIVCDFPFFLVNITSEWFA
jgi:hypothetical protein